MIKENQKENNNTTIKDLSQCVLVPFDVGHIYLFDPKTEILWEMNKCTLTEQIPAGTLLEAMKSVKRTSDCYKSRDEESEINIEELRDFLIKLDERLVLSKSFYPRAVKYLARFRLGYDYVLWLYEDCLKRDLNDLAAFYYTAFFKEFHIAEYRNEIEKKIGKENRVESPKKEIETEKTNLKEYLMQLSYTQIHELAVNPSTSPEILKGLADKDLEYIPDRGNGFIRVWVAGNPSTPVEVLEMLGNTDAKRVRSHVAGNPSTPVELLMILAEDAEEVVRKSVAKNINTPVEVLNRLADDRSGLVKDGVALNPSTSSDTLLKLARGNDKVIRRKLAGNENLPVEAFNFLAMDEDWKIRREVAKNPSASVEVLERLAGDNNERVRNAVPRWIAQNLNKEQVNERTMKIEES